VLQARLQNPAWRLFRKLNIGAEKLIAKDIGK
jgi:hypothetical protein